MAVFQLKEDDSETVMVEANEVEEIVPDADMRFCLLMLKNGDKHFVCGTEQEVRDNLSKN